MIACPKCKTSFEFDTSEGTDCDVICDACGYRAGYRSFSREQARQIRDEATALARLAEAKQRAIEVVEARPVTPITVAPPQTIIIQQSAPPPPTEQPRRDSGLGVFAFVLAILSLCFAWIPLLGMLLIPMAIIAGVLGFSALVISLVRGAPTGYPFAAMIVAAMAMYVAMAQSDAILTAMQP